MIAVSGAGGVPRDGIWRAGVFGAEIVAVQRELSTYHTHVVARGGSNGDRVRHRCPAGGCRDAHRRRRRVVRDGDGDGRRGGDVAGRVTGDGGQRMAAVGRAGRVPRDGIWRAGIFGAEIVAIQLELHTDHTHVVARAGRNGDRVRHGRSAGGCRDAHRRRRRVVRDGDGDGRRGGDVAGRVAGDGGQRMAAVGRAGGVPRDGIWRAGVFGAEIVAIQLELHTHHTHVVARGGRNGDRVRHGCSAGGCRDAHRRRRRVVRDGDGDGRRGGDVAGRVAGDGGQRMAAVGRAGRVPRDGIWRAGVFGAEIVAIQLELHTDHTHVVARAGRDGDRVRHRRPAGGRRDTHRRRRPVVRGGQGAGRR